MTSPLDPRVLKRIEKWATVPGYENYSVSTFGRVKNKKGLILKLPISHRGYNRIVLYQNRKPKSFGVHRLVMFAFVGHSPLAVNHINGIKTDNNLSNLEYCSHKENVAHAVKNSLYVHSERHGRNKLSAKDVLKIFASKESLSVLAKKYKVSTTNIRMIKHAIIWKKVIGNRTNGYFGMGDET